MNNINRNMKKYYFRIKVLLTLKHKLMIKLLKNYMILEKKIKIQNNKLRT